MGLWWEGFLKLSFEFRVGKGVMDGDSGDGDRDELR